MALHADRVVRQLVPRGSSKPAARRRCAPIGRNAGIRYSVADREPVPDEQHDQRADYSAHQAGALVTSVPANRLAEHGCDEGTSDAEQSRQDEALRIVGARREEARNDTAQRPITMLQMMLLMPSLSSR
jgi:hypothetical protein